MGTLSEVHNNSLDSWNRLHLEIVFFRFVGTLRKNTEHDASFRTDDSTHASVSDQTIYFIDCRSPFVFVEKEREVRAEEILEVDNRNNEESVTFY